MTPARSRKTKMMTRRTMVAAGLLTALPAMAKAGGDPASRFAELERRSGGRLGIAVLDTATGSRVGHRQDERFPLTSTFKLLAAAAVLAKVDRGEETVDRRITYAKADLVTYSPVTEKHVDTGMTLAEICDAAVTLSDNTAGNLLLSAIGGPAGLTAYARSLGDDMTRLDRIETELNEAAPGDPRDTTTPSAMAGTLYRLLVGSALAPASRDRLIGWALANKTGDTKLRAGVPKDWRVGEKTGAGGFGTNNDVGILWPPGRAPLIVAVYLTETTKPLDERNAVIAEAARIVSAGA